MPEGDYRYVIVGGGSTGASAVEGIREVDAEGRILLLGAEAHLPYDRPPLSKKLWSGQKQVEDIFVHDRAFYGENWVDLALGTQVTRIDPEAKTVADTAGAVYAFGKLLLATGGAPRRLPIAGGESEGLCYLRYLDDYLSIREQAAAGKSAVVIGGGFIGSEIAAALNLNGVEVTMIYPEDYLVARVFPEGLGRALQERYRERGISICCGDAPAAVERAGERFVVRTEKGQRVEADIAVGGIGIAPQVALAQEAGLAIEDGVVVNEYLQTSHPDIYAAGDNAAFPYQALGRRMRVEHWDNAVSGGRCAGRNMAGAGEAYAHMPYFFSDLFEFGYEAVGEVDSRLETFADWTKDDDTGVIYYLREGKVRGAMMCNVWDKVDVARELIRRGEGVTPEDLRGAIR